MKFNDLKKIMDDNFGTSLLADIAKEFEVTPQVVSNWKSRNQVPYKYVKIFREKIKEKSSYENSGAENIKTNFNISSTNINQANKDETLEIILNYFNVLWKRKIYLIIFVVFCFFIQLYILKFHTVPTYISKATILPSKVSEAGGSKLRSFAAQFGFGSNSQNTIDLSSSIMYPDIFSSKRLAKELLFKKFNTEKYGDSKPLINIINDVDYDSTNISERTKNRAAKKIQKMIKIRATRDSPLLKVSVSAFEAQFSSDLLNGVLDQFKELLKTFRMSRLVEKKAYILKRLEMVQYELDSSEDELKLFREKNRMIASSPALILQEERLTRIVEVKTQIYINLSNQYELVQIEEIGDSSILEVLDAPETPNFKSAPNNLRSLLASMVFGFVAISLFFLSREKFIPALKAKISSIVF